VDTKIYLAKKAEKEAAGTDREDYWKRQAEDAQRKLRGQSHEATAVEVLVEKAVGLAPVAYVPPAFVPFARKSSVGQPQSAVLMLSDTHVGQVVTPDQTLGLGGYNFELFLRRLAHLERSVFSILEDHTTTKVPEIVVAILGDCLHGNLSHAVEAGQMNTLFSQFYGAGHAFAQFLRRLNSLAPLRVHTVVGNHTRWGTQKKMPTDNRYSNLDSFLYAYVAALLRDCPGIQFNLDTQPFALFDVQGHHFFAGHGDTLKGGDKALGIPNHSIGRSISVTTQSFSRAGKPLPQFYLYGHMHRPIELPHANGTVIVNGGFAGLDGYALAESFTPAEPSQTFFLVHPKHGKAATYSLRLRLGDDTPHSYKIPGKFPCK
jgi:hypothetical protein